MAAQQYHGIPPHAHHLTQHLGYPHPMTGAIGMGSASHNYVLPTSVAHAAPHDFGTSSFGPAGNVNKREDG